MRHLLLIPLSSLAAAAFCQTICIDPGHVSEVGAGTRGKRLTEVHVAWRIGSLLAHRLRAQGYRVVMTKRSEREVVTNKRRAEIANAAKASLMVRLHCDASEGTGFTVYYPAQMGTTRDPSGPGGRMSGPTMNVISASQKHAKAFMKGMERSLQGALQDNGLLTDMQTAIGRKQGGALTGSIYSKVPVLLVEMVVLTNPKDEAFIGSPVGEKAMVYALASGVNAAVPIRR